jgi:L-cysteine/cystine lyase
MTIRDQLPSLEGVTYLNAGTNGPMPLAAERAMREELDLAVRRPRIGMAVFEHVFELRARARDALARTVNAPPEQVAVTTSTSNGVGIVIGGIDWNPGDEVITTTEEHQGILSPLDVISSRYGVDVKQVPADEIEDAIGERTRMVAVSHVLWTTGRRLDAQRLAAAAHEAGASLLLDGAQSVGAIEVDAPGSGADFYAFSGQKWLLGPQGTGGLWVSPECNDRLWTAQSTFWNLTEGRIGAFRPDAGRWDAGSFETPVLAGIAAAIEWVESLEGGRRGWTELTAANAARARERLASQPGVSVADPGDDGGPLIALTVDSQEDTAALVGRLGDQGILIRYIPNTPYLRVSVGAWTTDAEVDRLAEALTAAG